MDLTAFDPYHELTTVHSSTAFVPWRTGTSGAMMKPTAGRPRHDVKGNVMRGAYKVLANLLALLIVVQAALMVWAIAGMWAWVDDGNAMDKAVIEGDESPFTEFAGFLIHGMNGMMLIPLVTLALLVVSFFAKIPQGVAVAAVLLVLVIVQVVLGIAGYSLPFAGLLHGINALILFAGALHAARLPGRAAAVDRAHEAPAHV